MAIPDPSTSWGFWLVSATMTLGALVVLVVVDSDSTLLSSDGASVFVEPSFSVALVAVETTMLPISTVTPVVILTLDSLLESCPLGVSLVFSLDEAGSVSVAGARVVVLVVLELGISWAVASSAGVAANVVGVGVVVVVVVVVINDKFVVGESVCSVVSVSVAPARLVLAESSVVVIGDAIRGEIVVSADISWTARVVRRFDSYEPSFRSSSWFRVKPVARVTGS